MLYLIINALITYLIILSKWLCYFAASGMPCIVQPADFATFSIRQPNNKVTMHSTHKKRNNSTSCTSRHSDIKRKSETRSHSQATVPRQDTTPKSSRPRSQSQAPNHRRQQDMTSHQTNKQMSYARHGPETDSDDDQGSRSSSPRSLHSPTRSASQLSSRLNNALNFVKSSDI